MEEYIDTIPDLELKLLLKEDIKQFAETSELEFQFDLKQYNKPLYGDFDMHRVKFAIAWLRGNYNFMNVDDVHEVVW